MGKHSFHLKIKLNNNALFYFDDGFAAAISQWNSAGISTIDNGSSTSSDIVCKGGTRSELLNNVDWLSYSDLDGRTGITFWYDSFEVYLDYNSTQKYLYQLSSSYIFIVDQGSTVNQQKNTFIHELGHALGWYGHSALNSDIMYSQITSITTLTNRDKNHLVQVY